MAVREFTDSWGTEWRVWDVTPEVMHPITRSEEFMKNLQDGWLAFESSTEKRRIPAPYPSEWFGYSLKQLEELCGKATPVVRRPFTPSGEQRAVVSSEIERDAIESSADVRVFYSPHGKEWTVRVHECFDAAGHPAKVLRFTAGDVVVELTEWNERWRDASMEQYAVMLLDAEPPRRRAKGEGPQRRREDRPVG